MALAARLGRAERRTPGRRPPATARGPRAGTCATCWPRTPAVARHLSAAELDALFDPRALPRRGRALVDRVLAPTRASRGDAQGD